MLLKNLTEMFANSLNLKLSTPSYMVYGELGRYPIDIDIKVRTISYWARLLTFL
jgi:predicted 2-oxoglutarate/Fe(II)-dependent dioxygenase YbiX